jgi:D-glycerate 3-kinase
LVPERQPAFTIDAVPGLADLLAALDVEDANPWLERWQQLGGSAFQRQAWGHPVAEPWVWAVALPLLTALERHCRDGERRLVGLSGLPGCGKSTLARWLASASAQLDLPVAVGSIDDFYWPGEQLERSMAGNPWGVPRALPGSHDLELLNTSLERWRCSGELRMPRFEKSLRGGRGDRCGWHQQSAQVVLLEGWFLGACPEQATTQPVKESSALGLTEAEREGRAQALKQLHRYQSIWERLDELWHLKAPSPSASRRWKEEQEQAMEQRTGVRLPAEELESFVRMIETAIPEPVLQNPRDVTVVLHLTETRLVREMQLR